MHSLLGLVCSCVLNAVWLVTLIGGTGCLVSRWLTRSGPRCQHGLWVTTLGLSIVAPALPIVRSLAGLYVSSSATTTVLAAPASVPNAAQLTGGSEFTLPFSVVLSVGIAYVASLVFFACRLAWLAHITAVIRRDARAISMEPACRQIWERCRIAFFVEGATMLQSGSTVGPVTIGVWRQALVVPEEFLDACSVPELLAALAHECAHMRRRDFLKNMLYEVASLLIAFHPVTWALKSQIAQTREMICDEMATQKVMDTDTYTTSLLRLVTRIASASRVATSSAIGIFDANILEKRIMVMKTKQHSLSTRSALGLATPAMLALFAVGAGGAAVAKTIDVQPSAASASAPAPKVPVDLACTYYNAQGEGLNGTCGRDTHAENRYACTANDDRSMSQEQSGCEWKVQRAEKLKAEAAYSSNHK